MPRCVVDSTVFSRWRVSAAAARAQRQCAWACGCGLMALARCQAVQRGGGPGAGCTVCAGAAAVMLKDLALMQRGTYQCGARIVCTACARALRAQAPCRQIGQRWRASKGSCNAICSQTWWRRLLNGTPRECLPLAMCECVVTNVCCNCSGCCISRVTRVAVLLAHSLVECGTRMMCVLQTAT